MEQIRRPIIAYSNNPIRFIFGLILSVPLDCYCSTIGEEMVWNEIMELNSLILHSFFQMRIERSIRLQTELFPIP